MATYQVRTDSAGQKILSDPLTGLGSELATSETAGAVQPDNVTTKVDSFGILSALGGNLRLNDEIWITESGDWAAPVTGWYDVLVIGGGSGSFLSTHVSGGPSYYYHMSGGHSGAYISRLVFFIAGQSVSVIIGAPGQPAVVDAILDPDADDRMDLTKGGDTYFGDIKAPGIKTVRAVRDPDWNGLFGVGVFVPFHEGNDFIEGIGAGGGFGAAIPPYPTNAPVGAQWYGGGGSVQTSRAEGFENPYIGEAAAGAVRLRFWNPAKAAGPAGE